MQKIIMMLLVLIITPTMALAVHVEVRGVTYDVNTVFGNGYDGFSILKQMEWYEDPTLASEFATAVGLQLGYTNNGFADVAKPFFARLYLPNQRWMASSQYRIDIFGDESVNNVNLDMGISAHYAIATRVPIPAAAWLFGSGLLGLMAIKRRARG